MDITLIAIGLSGFVVWLLCAFGNAATLRAHLRAEPGESAGSMVPWFGGVFGVIAWNSVFPSVATQFGLPAWLQGAGTLAILLLDFGSIPYTVAVLWVLLRDRAGQEESAPPNTAQQTHIDAAVGCLLGVAVGDALGLPMEGLSRRRLERWHPRIEGHHLLPGYGLCSDDTEHNAMVALSVCAAGADVDAFAGQMRSRLRWWLLALPAGIGLATLRAILKLWLFLPRRWQGVYSAGNGAAMRAPLLGVLFADQPERLRDFVRASTRLTHTDPKAEAAALTVALAASAAARDELDVDALLPALRDALASFADTGAELLALLECAADSVQAGESSIAFAESLGLGRGVTGYAWHTVPVALHACLRHPRDYRQAVTGAIACGGDTDTVAAIVGGIVGAGVGREGIPAPWRERVIDWPGSLRWLERIAEAAARRVAELPIRRPREPAWLLYLLRNLLFMLVVLAHGFRRLLPPW